VKYSNDPFWYTQHQAEHDNREVYREQYARVAGEPPMKPILARFPDRLNGALMQIKQMPQWMWPTAVYKLIWPVIQWEIVTQSEEDSDAVIQAFTASKDDHEAISLLCDYVATKLQEVRDGDE
jgi:hypothetical protein